jgi:hypothetical protein
MTLRFTIKGKRYWVDEFRDGFAWINAEDEGPCFPTALEAQQHAIVNEQVIARNREAALAELLEDECYGTYQEQVDSLWKATRL